MFEHGVDTQANSCWRIGRCVSKQLRSKLILASSTHRLIPPAFIDPLNEGGSRLYAEAFFNALLQVNQGWGLVPLAVSDLPALHFHAYSPYPNAAPGTPLGSVANTATGLIRAKRRFTSLYINNQNELAPLPMDILVSEIGPWWVAKYKIEYVQDWRPKVMAGFFDNFRDGLLWWNTLLCWLTRNAASDCNLASGKQLFALVHEGDVIPFYLNAFQIPTDGSYAPYSLGSSTPTSPSPRNQWYFDSDLWGTCYAPLQAVLCNGLTSSNGS